MTLSNKISVPHKLLALGLLIVLFGLFSGLTFLHTMNSVTTFRELEKRVDSHFHALHEIEHHIQKLGLAYSDSASSPGVILNDLNREISLFSDHMKALSAHPLIMNDTTILHSIEETRNKLSFLKDEVGSLIKQQESVDPVKAYSMLHSDYIDPVIEARITIRDRIYALSFDKQRRYTANLIILVFINILIILVVLIINLTNNKMNAGKLRDFVNILEKGGRPGKLLLSNGIEFSEIAQHLNRFVNKQDEKSRFLRTIGEEDETLHFEPEKDDIIGNEIRVVANRLRSILSEDKRRQAEDKKANWTAEGIAQFAEILRSERENVRELSFLVIQKLITYLNIEMGTIFLTTEDNEDEKRLKTIAAYAYDRRKYIDKSFSFGEGLPGTCALEKEKIYINEVPEEFSDIISGVGQTKPRYVLLVPLKIEEEIFGIIELASFRGLEEHELDFVDQLAESIATTLQSVKTNEKTASLLRQSQEQAEQLLHNEQEMKTNLEKLEKAQEESHKKEMEITGILHAMNESSLVAEFNLNGRFTYVNDKFLELMESPREMVLGKHHHEFSMADKYAPEYKNFWEVLKKGNSVFREELFNMFSGKKVWLQQTFTPIKNSEGNTYKILQIAVDITRTKQQQENLEKQAAEIVRQNLEMESLSEAVNSAIIKCELDQDGIILNTNKNFEAISGLNRKEFLGRNYRLFLKAFEKEQFEKIWQEVLKGKRYEGATRRTKPTGEEVWMMSTFSPVKDEEGVIYKIYFLALDITEKKLKYQLLEEANKEIERLRNQKNA